MDEITSELLHYKKVYEQDDVWMKNVIKKKLLDDPRIIRVLNNPDLDENNPDDYYLVNILPYYLVPEAQTKTANYICYEVGFTETDDYNKIIKKCQVTFYIFADVKTVVDQTTGIPRHDLLAALISDDLNWGNSLGFQLKLVTDRPYAMDARYAMRTMVFESSSTNNITKNKQVDNFLIKK